jgi:hypothetical protein
VIFTLLVTLLIEGAVCLGYSIWRKKPVGPVLLTSLLANLVTQSLLWMVLNIFLQDYVVTLLIAEALIWLMESVFLFSLRMNRLSIREALLLSLAMNASSFGLGLFLPV